MDMCTYGTIILLNSDVATIYTSTHCSIVLNNRRQYSGKTSIREAEEIKMGRKEIAVVFSRKFHLFKLLHHLPLYNIMAMKPSKLIHCCFQLCHLTDWEVHDRNRIVNAWLAAVDVTSLLVFNAICEGDDGGWNGPKTATAGWQHRKL